MRDSISGKSRECTKNTVLLVHRRMKSPTTDHTTGPIVRITPTEIHVNDPTFIDNIFAGPGHRRDKGQIEANGLGNSPTTIGSRDHDIHKARRAALNPFFSTRNIRRLEPMVHEVLSKIFQRLEDARKKSKAGDDVPVNLNLLYRAAAHDLIADYALGQGSVCFSREDLNAPYVEANHQMVLTWHFSTFFPWFTEIIRLLPVSIVLYLAPTVKHFIDSIQVSLSLSSFICHTYDNIDLDRPNQCGQKNIIRRIG